MGVGTKLGQIIRERGMTQRQVAAQAKISPKTLNNLITRDSGRADIQMLLKICRVLNVDISVFADDAVEEFLQEHPESRPNMLLSEREKELVLAYRKNVEMQKAIDCLLGLPEKKKVRVFKVARSVDNTPPHYEDVDKEIIQRLINAPEVTEDL